MKRLNWKELGIDILVDLVAGLLIALGVYNIALNANFPVEGFSGISIILHHLFGLPLGVSLFLLNIPAAIFSFRLLGKTFFLKSIKSTVITSLIMDYIAPLLPVYNGSRFLAALIFSFSFVKGHIVEPDTDETVAQTTDKIIETTRDFILKELSKKLKGYDLESFMAHFL